MTGSVRSMACVKAEETYAQRLFALGNWFAAGQDVPPFLVALAGYVGQSPDKLSRISQRRKKHRFVWLRVTDKSGRSLIRENSAFDEVFSGLPIEQIESLKNGHSKLVLDFSNEGRVWNEQLSPHLIKCLVNADLALNNVILLSQNAADPLLHTKALPPLHLVNAHSFFARMWSARFLSVETRPTIPDVGCALAGNSFKEYDYICLNRNLRPAKALLVSRLLKRKERGLLSFSTSNMGLKRSAHNPHRFYDQIATLSVPGREAENIREVSNLLASNAELRLDGLHSDNPAKFVFEMPTEHLRRCCFYIVSETEMSDASLQRFTEKSIKAVISGLPFVVFGNYNTLGLLRELGFDVLDDLVCHDYDRIADPAERFETAWTEVERLLSLGPDYLSKNRPRLLEAVEHNKIAFEQKSIQPWVIDPIRKLCALAQPNS